MGDFYYIQDKRKNKYNCVVWWKEGGGYTHIIQHARIFTEKQAANISSNREFDVPWNKQAIDMLSTKVIKLIDLPDI